MNNDATFAVIGYGRFGALWSSVLSEHGTVYVYDSKPPTEPLQEGMILTDPDTALSRKYIFLCIPISAMEAFLQEHAKKIPATSTVIDTASVKSYPMRWMDSAIPHVPHMGLHPLFGPDSYTPEKTNLLIITPSEQYPELARQWSETFASWRFFTKIISADEHDRSIAYSQGVTHFIGNVLQNMDLPKTNTPTLGFSMLQDIARFCSNDTPQLFRDMLLYNPHSGSMFGDFLEASHEVSTYIRRENKTQSGPLILGVMGEDGSFSQEAGELWLQNKRIRDARILCFSNATKVYDALDYGSIDIGLLPIQNAVGGMVQESVRGLARYRSKITGFFPFLVRQCLLKRKDDTSDKPQSIHSHPQALRQCKTYLKKHFAGVKLVEEEDTAASARMLAKGELPASAWVIAPEKCVELYGLKLVRKNIQDLSHNVTDFITVIKD
jgi:prephenate dehydrogenase